MKLATLNNGHRDGQLLVVDSRQQLAVAVPHIAKNLQQALDNWADLAPRLQAAYEALISGNCDGAFAYQESQLHSPLPRAYHWADGSAYVNHVELVRKARGAQMPESFWHDPLMYQGGSDAFLPPHAPINVADAGWGIDFEGEVAVVVDDVPMGVPVEQAGQHIKLLMLVNDVSLRNLIPGELAKGFGFYQSKPSSSFSPLALTPDELGKAWDGGKVHLPLRSTFNGELFGQPNAGVDMTFDFPRLIAHAALSRPLCAGTIIGSGTVSNYDRSVGSSCLAERRMLETLEQGAPVTPFMQHGDTIRIEMLDADGNSLFGAIEQRVAVQRA